ncbi:hypothetical protein BDW22DRAFT_127156 [Trametopsis cervina]|nr:hypothetical protein BDW22DRAFT_127156 [Trametopsis cervina]
MASALDQQDSLILVMGLTGAGKTTFINKASGSNLVIGGGLESCTSEIQTSEQFELDGHVVTLVDTPGFDDTTRSEAEILRDVAAFLAKTYEAGRLLAGVIYLHRITDRRVGGMARRNMSVFRRLCGEATLKNAVVVTNMWSSGADKTLFAEEESREKELASSDLFFKRALENGAQMARHDNTAQSAHAIIRRFLANKPIPLNIQRELVDEKKKLAHTEAGVHFIDTWSTMAQRHNEDVKELTNQQEQEIARLRAVNAELSGKLRDVEEQTGEEISRLRGIVEQLTKELKETREMLKEEREKIRKLTEQTELLTRAGELLDKHLTSVLGKVEGLTKHKSQRRSRTMPMPPRDAESRPRTPQQEKPVDQQRERPTPVRSNTAPVETRSDGGGAWCVVQ